MGTVLAASAPGTYFLRAQSSAPPALPEIYQPQQVPPRWNSNIPLLTSSPEEAARIRTVSPTWLTRFLSFPSTGELAANLGRDDSLTREKAVQAIQQAVKPGLIPDGLADRLVPLARWGQLHDDWRRYGGVDIYLTKFSVSNLTVLLAETATHVIVVGRDTSFVPKPGPDAMRKTAFDYATILLSSSHIPDTPEDMRTLRQGPAPAYVYGFYNSRLNKLTGQDESTTPTETSDSANVQSVRYFVSSQLVAFMALKVVDDPAELGNPFEPRFVPIVSRGPDPSNVSYFRSESIGDRQIEEFLGMSLPVKEKQDFLKAMPVEDMQKQYLQLSTEQQIAIVRLKMSDEFLATGTLAFSEGRYEDAIKFWLRNFQLDPENPRPALLVNMALQRLTETRFQGNAQRAASNPTVAAAIRALREQQTLLKAREETRGEMLARERSMIDHRTKALQALSEGNLPESLKNWEAILRLDPGNANALVFRELVVSRMQRPEYRSALQRLPSRAKTQE